jgi:hypothetical protein
LNKHKITIGSMISIPTIRAQTLNGHTYTQIEYLYGIVYGFDFVDDVVFVKYLDINIITQSYPLEKIKVERNVKS